MHRVQPSNAPFTHLRSLYFTLGTLRLTTVTPVKTSEKLTYRPFKLFRDYSNSISLKSWQIKLGAEERRPRSNSERYSEIYPFHVRKRT